MKTTTIRQTAKIPAPPKAVYATYMDAKKHAAFTAGGKTAITNKVGGAISAFDGWIKGEFLKLRPGRLILQKWWTKGWPKRLDPSVLEIRLKSEGKGTRLTMIHSGVAASGAKELRSGWRGRYWKPMRAYFSKK